MAKPSKKPAPASSVPPVGEYANVVVLRYNVNEVFLDFGRIAPGRNFAELHTRIVTSPQLLARFQKQFEATLKEIVKKAKQEDGGSELPSDPNGER